MVTEFDEVWVGLAGGVPLHVAILEHEIGAAIIGEDIAFLGDDREALLGVAAIVDHDTQQLAVGRAAANVQGQLPVDRDEAALLNVVGHDLGADFGRPQPQLAQALRRHVDADHADQERDNDAGRDKRPEDSPWPHSRSVHDDQFRIVAKLVEDMRDRDHERDRSHEQDEQGYDEASDADEDQQCLSLAGHQVDTAQRLRDPHECGHADKNDQERTQRGAKDITPDQPHSRALPPISVWSLVAPGSPLPAMAQPPANHPTKKVNVIGQQNGLAKAKPLSVHNKTLPPAQPFGYFFGAGAALHGGVLQGAASRGIPGAAEIFDPGSISPDSD